MKRMIAFVVLMVGIATLSFADDRQKINVPKLKEKAVLTFAPQVPPPITRKEPALVEVNLHSGRSVVEVKPGMKYEYWTFNEHVPGPFIRVKEGDTIEVHHTSSDEMGMPHNIDFHAVTGPGGGAPVTTVVKGEERIAWFKMLEPGLYVYHCAAPPVMDHIANGMYGLILVEPKKGLPKVDQEYYVMQHEVYAVNPSAVKAEPVPAGGHDMGEEKKDDVWGDEVGVEEGPVTLQYSHQNGLDEHPMFVMFNETVGALMKDGALKANVGDKIRVYFGNAGPNLIASFHIIGTIFKNVYREGDLISPPAHSIQTTLVPAGGSTVVDIDLSVPGTFTLVDHAIFRIEKGAVGYLQVDGKANYDIYASDQDPVFCPGCLIHP
jgi:copper-containing nitrite reductase